MKWKEIKCIASKLRNNQTKAEETLWKLLRNRQLMDRKFLRQHPIIYEIDRNRNDFYFFIPDFYCASEKLVIELDGPVHDFHKQDDYKRDEILKSKGLHVIRIRNEELKNLEVIKNVIAENFKK